MNKCLMLLATVLIVGCAQTETTQESSAISKEKSFEDYIEVSELKELGSARTSDQAQYRVVSAEHVIIEDHKTFVLAKLQRCKKFGGGGATHDARHDPNTIRARFDTIRGCRIEALYVLDVGQAEELILLGMAPGE